MQQEPTNAFNNRVIESVISVEFHHVDDVQHDLQI